MSYIRFMLKKLTANKYNGILLLILVVLVGTVLYFSVSAKRYGGFAEKLEQSIIEKKETLAAQEQQLNNIQPDDERYAIIQSHIELSLRLIAEDEEQLRLYHAKEWQEAYAYRLQRLRFDKEIVMQHEENYDYSIKATIDHQTQLFEYLQDKNLEVDADKPLQGINFAAEYWLFVLPISVAFLLIFLLVNLYTDKFKGSVNIALLYPYPRIRLALKDLLIGITIGSGLFLLSLLLSFVFSATISGTGSWDYPYNTFDANGILRFVSVGSLLFPTLLVQLLALSICVVFVYCIAEWIANKSTTLIISLLAVLGSLLATNTVVPLQQIAHYNPFVYLNALGVVSGEFGHAIENNALSFDSGVKILPIYLAILISVALLLQRRNTATT